MMSEDLQAKLAAVTKVSVDDPVLSPKSNARRARSGRLSVVVDPSVAGRARFAVSNLPFAAGVPSINALVEAALDSYLKLLEREYNGGKPFDEMDPGIMRVGRVVKIG